MKTKMRVIVLALSLSLLLLAIPAQSGTAKAYAGPVPTLQSPTVALTVSDVCSSLPKLESYLAYLNTLKPSPFRDFLIKLTEAAIAYLKQKC